MEYVFIAVNASIGVFVLLNRVIFNAKMKDLSQRRATQTRGAAMTSTTRATSVREQLGRRFTFKEMMKSN